MTIALLLDNPTGSQEIYESVRKQLKLEKPAGGIAHVAGPSPNGGWRVIELFDSEEDAKSFLRERLGPALKAAGGSPPPPPQLWPVHNFMT